ncbi:MAG: putative collagen-binding domain-containing protein [Pirellulales bacterium]
MARLLETTRASGNVIYEVANETGGARWVAHFVAFIHRRLPGALVSAGEQTSSYDPVTGQCDLVVKHRGKGGDYRTQEDVARHRASLMQFRQGNKPVLHNEFFLFAQRSTDDVNFVRKMFWADFTGGGHANFYDFTWWHGGGRTVDEGRPSQPPPPEIMNAARYLRRFVEEGNVPFWAMDPHDELASAATARPFVLAQPGACSVVYLTTGGRFTLNLSTDAGTFMARWFNPREGRFEEPFAVAGGGRREFTAPDGNDWALVVESAARAGPEPKGSRKTPETTPPTVPCALGRRPSCSCSGRTRLARRSCPPSRRNRRRPRLR